MWLFAIVIIFLAIIFVPFRVFVLHPFKTLFYSCRDTFLYLYHRKWRNCPYGYIRAYTGLFGEGKTLSGVQFITRMYRKYNNKVVWCSRRKKFVTQKIQIVSNVSLSIPYETLVSLKQLVYIASNKEAIDNENDTLTISLAFIDEASVQLNSREFKNNIDALFLNTLLTCRHFYMGMLYTAQRYKQVDALLRQVTSSAIACHKTWRFQQLSFYDPWELENADNPRLVKPLRRKGWFVRNKNYNDYDTFATVDNLSKDCASGKMLTEDEILALQCNTAPAVDAITRPSKQYKRFLKKYK